MEHATSLGLEVPPSVEKVLDALRHWAALSLVYLDDPTAAVSMTRGELS